MPSATCHIGTHPNAPDLKNRPLRKSGLSCSARKFRRKWMEQPRTHVRGKEVFLHSVLVLVLFQVPAATLISIEALVREAQDDLKAERYVEARQKLEQAVKAGGNNATLWGYLGLACDRL